MNTEPTRRPAGIATAIGFLATATANTLLALQGGWWLFLLAPAAFFALLGSVGLTLDGKRRPRDANGHAIRTRKSNTSA